MLPLKVVVKEEYVVALRLHLAGQAVAEVQALLALVQEQAERLYKVMPEVMEQPLVAEMMYLAAVEAALALLAQMFQTPAAVVMMPVMVAQAFLHQLQVQQ